MRMSRRAVLSAACLLAAQMAVAAEAPVFRVNGRISEGNVRGLKAFIANSVGEVFALRIEVPKRDGSLQTAFDTGQLVIFNKQPGAEFQIVAKDGFETSGDHYVLDGFYQAEVGGTSGSIVSLVLTADKAADALAADFKMRDLQAGRLNPNIRN
jgi:hypothetical protein